LLAVEILALDASEMQKQQGRPLFFAVFNRLLLKSSDSQNGSLLGWKSRDAIIAI